MSTAYSGSDGKVLVGDVDVDVQNWTATLAINTWDSTTTADAGWDDSSPGTKNVKGTFDILWNKTKPPTHPATGVTVTGLGLVVGATVALELNINKTDEVALEGNALITQISVKQVTKQGIVLTISFENKGPWTVPLGTPTGG